MSDVQSSLIECRQLGCTNEAVPLTMWCAKHRYPERSADGKCMRTGCFRTAEMAAPWCFEHTLENQRSEETAYLRQIVKRAVFVAEHLMQMIDPQTWRDTGGDDGQGHYEGDYHAEQTAAEIERWKEAAGV